MRFQLKMSKMCWVKSRIKKKKKKFKSPEPKAEYVLKMINNKLINGRKRNPNTTSYNT